MPTSASDGLDDNESSDDESFEGVVGFEIDELFTSSDVDMMIAKIIFRVTSVVLATH